MKNYQIPIPIAPNKAVYLSIPPSLTPAKWDQMMNVLNAMKPALTYDPIPLEFGPGYTEPDDFLEELMR